MSFLVCEAERQNRTREEMSGVALFVSALHHHIMRCFAILARAVETSI
jgi:hypothetical protein